MIRRFAPANHLANHDARHPLRRTLPPPVPAPIADDSDWKLFGLSFLAFFVCFYTFLL